MISGIADATLGRIIDTVGDLPASPAIVSSVMGLTSDLDSKVLDISRVLSADQSLTAKVLKLSNSSFYGRSKSVSTLEEAILILGFFTVRSMVIATSAHAMYRQTDNSRVEDLLWRHSLSVAITARQMAARVGCQDREEVFISALLHDIGKLVMLQRLRERYLKVVQTVETNGGSFLECERAALGFDHCAVANLLLDKWSFPGNLHRSVVHHHGEHTPLPGTTTGAAPAIVSLANLLAKHMEVGFADHRHEAPWDTEAARQLALDRGTLEEILEESRAYYQSESHIYEES
ncbi:MAG: HDOD domain-containing protein [candidate division Zixibacteria bacterium]|nr:HDOD domain-containing protein [candidate division Zixibacteria bacterium]